MKLLEIISNQAYPGIELNSKETKENMYQLKSFDPERHGLNTEYSNDQIIHKVLEQLQDNQESFNTTEASNAKFVSFYQ